jgi:hypothetical protein
MVVIDGIRINVLDKSKGQTQVYRNESSRSLLLQFPCTKTYECTPYSVTLPTGTYRFELWGAQGGYSRYLNVDSMNPFSSGKGAYTAGTMSFVTESKLYFYVGGMGENQTSIQGQVISRGGFNGGGDGGVDLYDPTYPESSAGGGGASDIRYINDQTLNGLKSRIIVAAGGGGSTSTNSTSNPNTWIAGDGGKLSGSSYTKYSIPGNQTFGLFGKGLNGFSFNNDTFMWGGSTGGCGGGYYGGITTPVEPNSVNSIEVSGSGGSSYISGYEGCNSVKFDSSDPPTHSGSKIHYTNRVFDNPVMLSKDDSNFKDPYGVFEEGHFGNGAIKITIVSIFSSVSPIITCKAPTRFKISPFYLMVICLLHD